MRVFFVICALLCSFAPVSSISANEAGCGLWWCSFENVQSKSRVSQPCAVDIYLVQESEQKVKLRFYDANGVMLEDTPAKQKQHENLKQSQDHFCVGRHYVEVASNGGHAELINEDRVCTTLDAELLKQILAAGRTREGNPACLLGDTATCEELGFSAEF